LALLLNLTVLPKKVVIVLTFEFVEVIAAFNPVVIEHILSTTQSNQVPIAAVAEGCAVIVQDPGTVTPVIVIPPEPLTIAQSLEPYSVRIAPRVEVPEVNPVTQAGTVKVGVSTAFKRVFKAHNAAEADSANPCAVVIDAPVDSKLPP
jgi:hypothetical protein